MKTEGSVELLVSPLPDKSSEEKQLKDTFWKDLEEGRINVFEQDMYSKVKGRSARHQTSQEDSSPKAKKHKSHKSNSNSHSSDSTLEASPKHDDQQKTKRLKKRKKHVSGTHGLPPDKIDPSVTAKVILSPLPAAAFELVEAACASNKLDSVKTTEESGISDKSNKTLSVSEQSVIDEQVKKSCRSEVGEENVAEAAEKQHKGDGVRLSAQPASTIGANTNVPKQTVKEKLPKGGVGDIAYSFEFTHYNPEDWLSKEVVASGLTARLTNGEFRDAVKRGDYEILRRALNDESVKKNLEQTDTNGTTLLMIAAASGFDDIVELLVIHGANINAVQKTGSTALILAADLGHICCVAVLLGLGAHVNISQHLGETALMKACKRGNRPIVQLLLEQGANFAMVTNSDTNALKLAKPYLTIQHLLTDHISRVTAAFEAQVKITTNNTAYIVHALFPLQCFSLNEETDFRINFNYQLQPSEPGVGMLLFIAHSRITPQEVKCRFYGPCAVLCALLNGVKQNSLTEEANFVLSFSPLKNGKNDLTINTVPSSSSKGKLLVCAYKAKLMGSSKTS